MQGCGQDRSLGEALEGGPKVAEHYFKGTNRDNLVHHCKEFILDTAIHCYFEY